MICKANINDLYCSGFTSKTALRIHIAVDSGQEVVAIGPSWLPGIHRRNAVAEDIPCYGSIISCQIALDIQRQKTHAAGTGIFQIGVQEIGCFSHAGSANHQHMNIIGIYQRRGFPATLKTQYNTLGKPALYTADNSV